MLNRVGKYTKICECRHKQTQVCQLCTHLDSEDAREFVKFRFFWHAYLDYQYGRFRPDLHSGLDHLSRQRTRRFSRCLIADQLIKYNKTSLKNPFCVQIFTAAHFTDRCVTIRRCDKAENRLDARVWTADDTKTLLRGWTTSATLFNITEFGNSEHNNTCFPVAGDRFRVRCESRLGPKKSVDKYQLCGT